MKYLAIISLLFASTALAQGPVNYPPEVYAMNDAQFKQWADSINAGRIAAWKLKKEEAKADQPQYLEVQSASSDSHATAGSMDVGGNGKENRRTWNDSEVKQQNVTFKIDNPKYVNPGPLTLVNPFCRPKAATAEELAEIKRIYDEAGGYVLTVHSADGTPLHMKVE